MVALNIYVIYKGNKGFMIGNDFVKGILKQRLSGL